MNSKKKQFVRNNNHDLNQVPYVDADIELWRWLGELRHAMHKARTRELRKYNITTVQSHVMFVILALKNRATPTHIAKWIFRESHSITEILNRMERDGLIVRIKDLRKKSMVRLQLTEKGLEIHYKTTKFDSIHSALSLLSKEERRQLKKLLEKVWYKTLDDLGLERVTPFPAPEVIKDSD